MHNDYSDIRKRIPEPPKWFDSNGVPRYDEFRPEDVPSIYAGEACLMEIACQACGERIMVGMERHRYDGGKTLAEAITENFIHYGDPPIHGDGCSGNTMNCEDLRVVQYWRRKDFDWERDPTLEVELPQDATA